ncbi:ABC transporter, ATP-binding protein [Lactobacillus pasteurii DSM 23907 = CRBIP 24.76]|uniref:Cobalt import ATP-binding protein cbiO 1 n=1 Tax=Lactobacillus pasteurii DSM 23907 = CRBIP 24.76 TaxID=1423790 RepID=I7IZM0_9LACO|nr:energy-coupling factor ABC transporter ATP-binding protein [Lactobacillus pasteurii]KRK08064.1 ABC transporter, ATP-binding protein [Lactobacillus pasteurii DSM 23907 = CRBIP 24.76]TDG76017.1 hypothetical protein C5L33_001575 [Lactobacillus pasteurii]CCI85187.1 Cobalt import ATP-binding protein cbiO 1 [Lactobacillus pasteurii DSM 23907 = CRBIP 24.76]
MEKKKIISFKNVSLTYPETKKPAVDNVSFDIAEGSWTAIIGHNGSGKSTITRLINGLLVPDNNPDTSIIVDGITLTDDTIWDVRDRVGIVFQNPDNQFVGATVADDVAFGLENRGIPRSEMLDIVEESVRKVGMASYMNAEPANLSGGQKQRVAIAGILAVKPKIIILDEATSMLDPNGRDSILSLVREMKAENNLTVISITHDIDEADEADDVIVLDDGVIIDQGSPEKIFNQPEMIERIGLEEPFIFKLKQKLIEAGIEIPDSVNKQEELLEVLWQLNSNM